MYLQLKLIENTQSIKQAIFEYISNILKYEVVRLKKRDLEVPSVYWVFYRYRNNLFKFNKLSRFLRRLHNK